MPLSGSSAAEGYVDRGIQTISPPALWLTRSVSNSTQNSSTRAHHGSLAECSSNVDTAYSRSVPDNPSPVRSAMMAHHTYKRQKVPYSRFSFHQSKKRVVSLPEDPHIRTKHHSKINRMVSLPDRLPPSSIFTKLNSSSELMDASLCMDQSIFVEDEHISRIRVRSPPANLPHTPSPPSSPDSVLIIDDSHQLSETFLCCKSVRDSQQLLSDDDGVLQAFSYRALY